VNKQGITLIVSYVIKSETPLRLKDLIQSKKKKKQQKKEEGATELSSESIDSPLRREFFLILFNTSSFIFILYSTDREGSLKWHTHLHTNSAPKPIQYINSVTH
jgi:hypothetical protein